MSNTNTSHLLQNAPQRRGVSIAKPRFRFAPSPTGYLHIGSLRQIIFNYLAAKQMNGKFFLRVEDTDQKREVPGAVQALLDIIKWLGIEFDEGPGLGGDYGSYIQSERQEIYDEYKKIILEKGAAYPCFCSEERLTEMRAEQAAKKQAPRYDRYCRNLSSEEAAKRINDGEPYVIRQKMPLDGEIKVNDYLRGEIVFKAADIDDQILIKASGIPTYQFASVVDDHLMETSHVLRGEEWIPSLPKNILLYEAFGWEPPIFAHIPVTLNKGGGGKLSKRQGDVSVESYRANGYLREALINFNVLQGWHPKGDNEILTLKEMEEQFRLEDMGASPSVFDIEKLDFFNGYYIRQKNIDELYQLCLPFLSENVALTDKAHKKEEGFLKKVIQVEQERLKKLSEIVEKTRYFFLDALDFSTELLLWKKLTLPEIKKNLEDIVAVLGQIPDTDWNQTKLNEILFSFIQESGAKVGDYLWPLRVSLSGEKASPGPYEIAEILGKKDTLERVQKVIGRI